MDPLDGPKSIAQVRDLMSRGQPNFNNEELKLDMGPPAGT